MLTDGRWVELGVLFTRLKDRILEAREAASSLYDQEEDALWNLSPEEKAEVPELSTWGERKFLYVQIKKMKRIRSLIRCRLYGLQPRFSRG